jgi:hypothetical protein
MDELKELLESDHIELSLVSMRGGTSESCVDNINCFALSTCSGSNLCSRNACGSLAGKCGANPACGGIACEQKGCGRSACVNGADRDCGGVKTCSSVTCLGISCVTDSCSNNTDKVP